MTADDRKHIEDLRGATKLAVEATKAVTALVQDMHVTIGGGPAILGSPLEAVVRRTSGLVYKSIETVTDVVGMGLDGALSRLAPALGDSAPGPEREAVVSALNGVLGDYLQATDNPLAIEMRFRHDGTTLDIDDREALAAALPEASGKILVLVHGSSMNDRQWLYKGHDHGAALAEDLGFTPVRLLYNSGLHTSINGDALASQLDALVSRWPVPVDELTIVAHSMGGLVARSACIAAESASLGWRKQLKALVCLGTPHHGAPLEVGGSWVDVLLGVSRYSAPLARLGRIRSAGVTDLRYGNVLEEHWKGRDRFERQADSRSPAPLPAGVACFALAGTVMDGTLRALAGDGLVPVESALGEHEKPELTLDFPEAHKATMPGVGHLELLSDPTVYETIRDWLNEAPST